MVYDFQFFLKKRNIIILWILTGLIIGVIQYFFSGVNPHINNFIIFKSSFNHLLLHQNLYLSYPSEYYDVYIYGPIFAFLIAPFAALPTWFAYILWSILNAGVLIYAIYQLPISDKNKALISWISFNSLLVAMQNSQFHALCVAFIILSYTLIQKKQYFWAAFFLVLGTAIKLYGIVGLAFFFFVENKPKYILYCVLWTVIFFVLPMVITNVDYIVQCYVDWYHRITYKNVLNVDLGNHRTDVCVMGMFRRLFDNQALSNLYFIITGLLIFAFSYIRVSRFKNIDFQLRQLASALLFIILASTGSESPTIVIGVVGLAIWYVLSEKTTIDNILLWFALIISSFSATDFFPEYLRVHYVNQYALIVLPLLIVWLKLNWENYTSLLNKKSLT